MTITQAWWCEYYARQKLLISPEKELEQLDREDTLSEARAGLDWMKKRREERKRQKENGAGGDV